MLIKELKALDANSLLASSHLWNRRIETVKPTDLLVFLRTHWRTPHFTKARQQIELLIDVVWQAMVDREIPAAPLIHFSIPEIRITIGELSSWLSSVSHSRRRAILFGLESGLPIGEIISITWGELRKKQLSQYGMSICGANARHISLDYVFWEYLPGGSAAPLFGLSESAYEVSQGLGYGVLQRLYKTIIPTDSSEDLYHFTDKLCIELNRTIPGQTNNK